MSEGGSTDKNDKGSWEAALAEFQDSFLRESGGIGYFTHDSDLAQDRDRDQHDAPTESESVRDARWVFRTLMTFCTRKLIATGPILIAGESKPSRGWVKFDPKQQEDIEAAKLLLGSLILRFAKGDEDFFTEIVRLKKAFDSMGKNRDELSAKSALYLVANDLRRELGRDPTRPEVIDRLDNTTKHRVSDGSSLFRSAKLGFLKDGRGRPKKYRSL
jgi:hypothetical protein